MYNKFIVRLLDNDPKKVLSKGSIRARKNISPVRRFAIPFVTPNSKLKHQPGCIRAGLFDYLEGGVLVSLPKLHTILKCIIRTQRKHKFVFLNKHPDIPGNCIYAVNHSCKWDCQFMMELGKGRCFILTGKQRLLLLDRIVFHLNGAVWVDRKDKASKASSKEKMEAVLRKGNSLCIFPEGTWNLRPSLPVLPLYWGIVDVAKNSGVPIVPMCFEYRGKECYVKYGDALTVNKDVNKAEIIDNLRDTFATLKWDIWEGFPLECRGDIFSEYWDNEIKRRLREYKKLDYEYEMSCVRETNDK